ncbi:MAG: hypothetical protein A3B82_00750 [Methylophilales bacterium RIFCSPHIGHO2_02_FULL_57_10]|nr:MAG: hypothetical protein A3B82_00750 [Methylophilales bacterium RIFCSPHIGHO2_02_FULL_57_10]
MSQLTALSVSIGVLGGLWAYLALGPLAGMVLVWAGFIAWGCYFHTGGDTAALQKTIAGTVYGAVLGWVALLLVVNNPASLPDVIAAPVYVAVTVFLLVIVAGQTLLSVVPANVYGYAAIVAYSLQTPTAEGAGPLASLTAVSFANPLILLSVSYVAGAVLGMLSGKLAGALGK